MTSLPSSDRSPPSTASVAIATAILGVAIGYFIGQGSSLGLFSSSHISETGSKAKAKKSWPNSYDVTVHPDSSDEELMKTLKGEDVESLSETDEEEEELGKPQEGLSSFTGNVEECKLVLVVRTDLGMGKGQSVFAAAVLWQGPMQSPC